MTTRRRLALAILGTTLLAGIAHADASGGADESPPAGATHDDAWTRFRGPGGAGHARGPLPTRWNETEGVLWSAEVPGRGWSSPVVLEGRIWVTTSIEDPPSLRAVALDLESGRLVHDVEVFRPESWGARHATNTFASPTPALEPGRAWVHFGTYGTASLDAATGEVLWRNEEIRLDDEVGPGSSPIVWSDLLIVHFDGTDLQEVVAFDTASGAIAWRTPRWLPERFKPPHRKAFSTPIVIDTGRREELISPGAQQVVAYDPRTGRRWWTVRYDGYSIVPGPIANDRHVFVVTGYMQAHLLAIRPEGTGDVTEERVDWDYRWQVPRNSTPLLLGDRIFFVNDQGRASWLDAGTSSDLWLERLGGNHSASPITDGKRIWAFSEEGIGIVLEPDDEGPRVLARNELDGQIYATPAAVDGTLVVRTDRRIYRIGGIDDASVDEDAVEEAAVDETAPGL